MREEDYEHSSRTGASQRRTATRSAGVAHSDKRWLANPENRICRFGFGALACYGCLVMLENLDVSV